MRIAFENYWPLILLLAIPWLWWVRRRTAVDLSPKQQQLVMGVRSATIVLMVLALMQPILYHIGKDISVIYLLDVSKSIAPAALQDAFQWIRQTNDAGKPADARFLAFGSNSILLDSLDALTHVQISDHATNGSAAQIVDQSETHISDALDHALRSLSPDHLKRLVLISDGNDNSGDLAGVMARLRADKVPVYTRPMETRSNGDTWIETIMSPATVTPEQEFPVEVHIYTQKAGPADVELRNGEKILGRRTLSLNNGLNRIAFQTSVPDESSTVTLEASVKAAGDPLPDNNVFRQSVTVMGKPRILYVEGYAPSAKYLTDALKVEGLQVDTMTPDALPATVDQLDAYDAVVLSDVEKKSLNDEQMQSISTYVRDLGGGFILAGGENVYGEKGYSKTKVEEALPVTFNSNKKQSVGMVIVLDRSGSMAGLKIELAKVATAAPLDILKDTDHFGVIVFDYNWKWIAPLQPAANRIAMKDLISKIVAQGETNIYPALHEAQLRLAEGKDDIKHIILLSDGRSLPDDFEPMVTEMNKKDDITVSAVAVGSAADRELLSKIAKWGNGRYYFAEDPKKVPQIFADETQQETIKELPFVPVVKKEIDAFKGIEFKNAPKLLGYVTSKPKDSAEIVLETDKNDPLLARWQFGVGKAVVFTSDVKDRWAVDWLKWKDYPKFWSQLVRETMRPRNNDDFDFQVKREGDVAHLTINAIQRNGQFRNKLQTQIRVVAPDQSVAIVEIPQIGPGSYKADVPLKQKGTYIFHTGDENAGGPSRVLPYSYPDEYHFYPPNTDTLRAISMETGGTFQPKSSDIFDPRGETTAVPTPLWPWLAAAALAFYVLDIFIRRLRLFE